MTGSGKYTQKQPVISSSEKLIDVRIPSWTVARIRHELELRGYTLSSLSRAHGLHSSACGLTLKKPWPRVERIIADTLGVKSPSEIFPDRYDAISGYPLKFTTQKQNTDSEVSK